MKYLARSVDEVIDWSKSQITNPTQSWDNLCQSHCRQAYGVGPWASSAKVAWNSIPTKEKVIGGSPSDAPRGALIYFDSGSFGHVAIAVGKSTNNKCLSNDYVRQGKIDYAPRDFKRWNLHYAGWSAWTPFGALELDTTTTLWDGVTPSLDGCFRAQNHSVANPQAYRLATRLFDLGFFVGTPVKGTQKYPVKAVAAFQQSLGWPVAPDGAYSPEVHSLIFPA
jgi:hypothetical protein